MDKPESEPSEPQWNIILHYTRLMEPSLSATSDPYEVQRQEGLLTQRLQELRLNLPAACESLERLSAALQTPPHPSTAEALDRLSSLAQCTNYIDFYHLAEQTYPTPDLLENDLARYQGLIDLADSISDIATAKSYLDKVALRGSDGELAMDRLSILEQLTPDNLLANPHLWPSVKALFDWFRSRYLTLYEAQHQAYHQELASLRAEMVAAGPRLHALERLNSIAELGPAVGKELTAEYQRLLSKLNPCPAPDLEAVASGEQPACPSCGFLIVHHPPTTEVRAFLDHLNDALGEQQHRLATEAIRQILSQSKESRIDQFIRVLQTSDLSSLANVMDDELVNFLRKLLAEAETHTEWYPILRRLIEKYPVVEEGQADQVVAELAALLKEAFAEAKRRNPGKRIRIALE